MFDYHIHTKYCNHAVGTMEEYVQAAIDKNLSEMGFACHMPFELMPSEVPREEYAMSLHTLNSTYFPEIERLQQKYKHQITIKTGLEIDYCQWIQQPIDEFIDKYSHRLDYILGSVHILKSNDIVWGIDDHRFSHIFNEIGVDVVYQQYINALENLVKSGKYTILAHLDLPKKYGFHPTNRTWYLNRIELLLDLINDNHMGIECSTGGLRKHIGEIYPEEQIIKIAIQKGIPLITSSDAHNPNEVAYNFPELYSYLKRLGLTHLTSYNAKKKSLIEIS
ncbi:MAG: histidinol-phosphatase HisJ [Candidatus Lokiarchaeota archaeon]|nr:histidinol-phosphatase HisJ [Candidatus Lokiarchaeota archaeon]